MTRRFTVYGRPAPKGSRTVGTRKNGTHYTRPASKYEKAWALAVQAAASSQAPVSPPYRVDLVFVLPRPNRPTHAWPSSSDSDKLARNTIDALVSSGLMKDDRHVVDLRVSKRWGDASSCTIAVKQT